jgi:cell division protein FtsQ
MDRSLAVLLGRPFATAGAARTGAARTGAARAGTVFAWVWPRRRLRIALLVALCMPVLAVGGWLLLRSTSLSAVEHVRVSGVHGRDAAQIEATLTRAARGMSTLHVRLGALRAAVSQFPVVRDLRVSPSFPHGLHITVIEQPPVAELLAAGGRTAVAADGVVLGSGLLGHSLPSVHIGGVAPLLGQRVADAGTRAELSVLGAAPATLLGWVQSVASGSEGLTVTMRTGLEIYFGNATRPHAKWLAAARVLADSSAAGASYIDVRLPERPVAASAAPGGLNGASGPAGATGSGAATLAAKLDEAVAGGSAGAAASTTASSTATSSPAGEPNIGERTSGESASGEPAASAGSQAPSTGAPSEASGGGGESGAGAGGPAGAPSTGEATGTPPGG